MRTNPVTDQQPTETTAKTAEQPGHDHAGHGYITSKDDYLKRLRRIEGQARGLQRMVEEEKYCIDILTQVSAMTKALQAVAMGLLEDHISHCVVDAAVAGGPEAEAKIKEATDAIARLVRS
ncbi:metal-sensitive transcriptional regulator [Nocardia sp. NPDC020380]|uniref:metal-sensitive transcriptional regulator n=1 Tax=Nocardia sp. NPDC020380 TaxID=3364309 RepID=UPI0037A185BF